MAQIAVVMYLVTAIVGLSCVIDNIVIKSLDEYHGGGHVDVEILSRPLSLKSFLHATSTSKNT